MANPDRITASDLAAWRKTAEAATQVLSGLDWHNFYTDRRYRGVEDAVGRMMYAWLMTLEETMEAAQSKRDAIKGLVENAPRMVAWMEAAQAREAKTCTWTEDANRWGETLKWDTACGEAWTFIEGGPTENNVRFCHGCGHRVVVAPAQD